MSETDAQLAATCHRCGYALGGLSSPPCPECGATDVTLEDERKRAELLPWDSHRVPAVLTMCLISGVIHAVSITIVLLAQPTMFTSRLLATLSVPLSLVPAGLAWWYSSASGPGSTATHENLSDRRLKVNLAGAGALILAVLMK